MLMPQIPVIKEDITIGISKLLNKNGILRITTTEPILNITNFFLLRTSSSLLLLLFTEIKCNIHWEIKKNGNRNTNEPHVRSS